MEIAFLTAAHQPPGGGSAFNAGLVDALRARGHQVRVTDRLDDAPGLPLVDGLLLPALEPELDTLAARDAVVLVHHVSAAAGRDQAARTAVGAAERRMLPVLRRVLASSQPVADRLRTEFGVAAPGVLHPGWPHLPRAVPGPGCAILSVGVLTPRKGHDRLLAALGRLTDLDWTLCIAGDPARDPAYAATVPELAARLGLADRVRVLPPGAPLEPEWAGAALFASATAWEGYPFALAEALRRGIPAVAPRLPGIEVVIPAAAAVLYAPDDAATFGKCLRRAIFDETLRAALAAAAGRAGDALPDWDTQAGALEAILES